MIINLFLFFIIGLIIGSFINVLIARTDDLQSIVNSRSHCPKCKTKLAWYDLIPILSFALLKARCRYCQKPISWQYPVVELSTGAMFALLYYFLGFAWPTFYYAIIFSILMVVLVHDIRSEEVPEIFVWIALGLSIFGFIAGGFGLWSMILGGIISGGFLALIVFISKEKWMGAGDIKLGIILGFLLGYPLVWLGLFLSFVLGSIIGIILMGLKLKSMKDSVPFAPFLILAMFVSVLIGKFILAWYTGIL